MMNNDIIQISSSILSIAALIFVFLVFSVNTYFKIRKCFPVRVNCWFCNTWTKVLYENSNSFDCPNCLQYNGFTQDGSYNKIIDAQHNVTLQVEGTRSTRSSNGFCDSCNHNQQLKITQLASFTPLKEENYDIEIEHFKKQLEKAYQLCRQCTGVLKYTLLKEKASFFGRHVHNIQKKGLNLYLNKSNILILTNPISVRIIKKIQGFIALFLILNLISQVIFCDNIFKLIPLIFLPYYELIWDVYLLLSHIMYESFCYVISSFSINVQFGIFKYFSSIGLTLQLLAFSIESSILSIKVNQILCWSFLTVMTLTTTEEIFFYSHFFQIFCAALIFYHSAYEFDVRQSKKSFEKLKNINDLNESSDEELDITPLSTSSGSFLNYTVNSSLNKSNPNWPSYYKIEKNIFTANNISDTSVNTAKNINNANLYSNIQNSLEDLHLGNSTFRIGKSTPIVFKRSSPLSDRSKLVLSPSKLKTVTQNSWVAGGFWRNEDGSIVPISENTPLSRSSSQSSGFGSQINEMLNNSNNPFNSLPTSRKNSVCGELDRFSLASEPPYHFHPLNPQPSWTTLARCGTEHISNSFCNNTYKNTQKSFNQSFDEFALPTVKLLRNQMPLYNSSKPLGLFKLPQRSAIHSGIYSTGCNNSNFIPLNNFQFGMNSGGF